MSTIKFSPVGAAYCFHAANVAPTALEMIFDFGCYKYAAPLVLDTNRALITRFGQKIQTTLARIWGE